MLKQPDRESRNVNDFFYEMECRQIEKMNKVLTGVELTKAEEKTLIWLAGWEESTVDNLPSVIEKTARIRADQKGGYAHKSKRESEQYRTLLNKNKPSAFESEIYPSHKLRLCSVYFALRGLCRIRQLVRKQVPMHLLTVKAARVEEGGCL